MARTPKKNVPLHGLDEGQVKILRDGIEKVEKIEEKLAQLNADKRSAMDRIESALDPLGFTKQQVRMVIGRRKKDRDRVKSDDIAVRKLENALGMATADMFDEVENTMKSSKDPGEVVEASLAGGNAAGDGDDGDGDDGSSGEMEEADNENFRNEGRAAWARSVPYSDGGSYPLNSPERSLWQEGWSGAQKDFEEEQSGSNVVDLASASA